jgi:hypothetical protein
MTKDFQLTNTDNTTYFEEEHSEIVIVGDEDDQVVINIERYDTFELFWNDFTKMEYWFRLHALIIHDEIKPLIKNSIKQKQLELNSFQEKSASLISHRWFKYLGLTNENY